MAIHAEAPILAPVDEIEAGLASLVFFIPDQSPESIEVLHHHVQYAAAVIRGEVEVKPIYQKEPKIMWLELEGALSRLKAAVGKTTGRLALTIESSQVGFSRAETLIDDYGSDETADGKIELFVPGDRITAVGALALGPQANIPQPVLDLRIQTMTTDESPLVSYVYRDHIRTPVEEPHPGRWHRFSLDNMIIEAEV